MRKARSRALLDLDRPEVWPAELRSHLDAHYDLFFGWETEANRVAASAYDRAIYSLWDALQSYEILGWHCTRLTDLEVDDILCNGMRLPDAAMLARRIDTLVKADLVSRDVARRLKSENQADENGRAGMVWFCFFPPRVAEESGIERFFRHWGGEALYIKTPIIVAI